MKSTAADESRMLEGGRRVISLFGYAIRPSGRRNRGMGALPGASLRSDELNGREVHILGRKVEDGTEY
jgi:hypothetical protein